MKLFRIMFKLIQIGLILSLFLATAIVVAMLLDDLNLISVVIMIIILVFVIFLWMKTA